MSDPFEEALAALALYSERFAEQAKSVGKRDENAAPVQPSGSKFPAYFPLLIDIGVVADEHELTSDGCVCCPRED